MFFAQRHVRKLHDSESPSTENSHMRLDEVRDQAAWVLLGGVTQERAKLRHSRERPRLSTGNISVLPNSFTPMKRKACRKKHCSWMAWMRSVEVLVTLDPVSDSGPVEMLWKSPIQDCMSCSRLVWFDRSRGSKGYFAR